ncbi:MAG TPA: long-chain-acyl-CoA synthetase [Caulobacteraceae bacterium]|nr:long-chain-acyl-CoA synthetase [Caulobacteraceae bacterium]
MLEGLRRDLRFLTGLIRTLLRVASIAPRSADLVCDDFERAVDRFEDRPAIRFEGAELSYADADALANRCAHWALAQGLARGEAVALFLPNRAEYLPLWMGLTKAGVVGALVNYDLRGQALAHCLALSGAKRCIVDATTAEALAAARPFLQEAIEVWTLDGPAREVRDLGAALQAASPGRPPRSGRAGIRAADMALYIFTSGTTGLPKAARINHMRAQLYMRGFAGSTGARASDRIYVTLPLYHATGGLCATGAALLNGGCVLLRREFSAGHFWSEIAAERATMFVYVGELCRYLANQPSAPDEARHGLRLAFGNGLSAAVWETLERRFAVPRVLEFYGSTEGNVYLFNFDGGLGACGRLPPWLEGFFNVALVRFDLAAGAPARDGKGRCIRAGVGEAGECLGRIAAGARTAYSGYVDRAASEAKVLEGVFKTGDRWFATGDLMRRDRAGYLYFVDRVGDTFRWKGQNVSTGEVEGALMEEPNVAEAVVYGVKVGELEGRAGMAAMVVGPDFDPKAFAEHIDAKLPPYARPVFLRLEPRIDATGTFKPRKTNLAGEGFDPAIVGGLLYVRDPGYGFERVTPERYRAIVAGETRL